LKIWQFDNGIQVKEFEKFKRFKVEYKIQRYLSRMKNEGWAEMLAFFIAPPTNIYEGVNTNTVQGV